MTNEPLAEETVRPRTAIVLAAGFGQRMRPLSKDRPKALVEVAGRSLIDHSLDQLAAFGIERVVVNLHHQADALERHLAARAAPPQVLISDEREQLLDTGGGVQKALPLLGPEPFFVVNCDALWRDGPEGALARLAAAFEPATMAALLLLVERQQAHNYGGTGDFERHTDGRLQRPGGAAAPFVFAGLQILDPAAFKGFTIEPYSLNRVYDLALEAGRLFGCLHDGEWFHVGTPEAVDRTNEYLER
jgi:MurNAc alpha-1-phosphate uridylyltransferase